MIREWQWKGDNASARGHIVSADIFLEILQKLLVVNPAKNIANGQQETRVILAMNTH